MKEEGFRTAKLDIQYMNPELGENPMDLLSDSGFGFLGLCLSITFPNILLFFEASGTRTPCT